ncbi:MAG: hypothetical protein QF570_12280 [Myxococcota bacterium]|jgi:hypothetical protein|nr:hypothetical protein [Myxococcota bacterium]
MRAIGIILAIVIIMGAGIAWWVTTSLDRTLAETIEQVGSELLDTRLGVAGVETDLRAGRASIFGLEVANPEGDGLDFSSQPAFELGEITVAIDIASLGDGPIPITLVRVLAPKLNGEVTSSGINFNELRDRLNANGANAGAETGTEGVDSGEPTRLRIDVFEFAEGSIQANTEAVGGDIRELKLPAVKLKNLSGTPGEIGQQVLDVYLDKATRAVGVGQLEAEARKQVKKQVKRAKKKAKKKLGKAASSLLGGDE